MILCWNKTYLTEGHQVSTPQMTEQPYISLCDLSASQVKAEYVPFHYHWSNNAAREETLWPAEYVAKLDNTYT